MSQSAAPVRPALARWNRWWVLSLWTVATALGSGPLLASDPTENAANPPAASPPLHQRIDSLVSQAAVGPLAPLCSDADFLRRIYLDLTGVIPSSEQAKAFLADESPAKRSHLIDALLASPDFARHMAVQLNVLLLDRRTDKYVDQKEWEAYLIDSITREKPLDQMVRELIDPDRLEDEATPARKFLLNRDAEPHAMTRDVGRLLFGMDLQCAQCHDHPLIDDYYQADYYGLFAFLHRTSLFEDPASKLGKLAERADGEAPFESVFTGEGRSVTKPRLPKGNTLYVEPTLSEEEAYRVKPEKTQAAKPTFSRRQALANMLVDSTQVRRNLANRVWALIMGRGLVHPADFHHSENPPANPLLLSLLAEEFADNGFDLRYLVRELVLTKTYQRSCDVPQPETLNFADIQTRQHALANEKETLLAELAEQSLQAKAAEDSWRDALALNDTLDRELPEIEAKLAQAQQAAQQADAAAAMAAEALEDMQGRLQSIETVVAATDAAIGQTADEPVLAETLTLLKTRLEALTGSVSTASGELEAKSAAAKQARQAVTSGQAEVAEMAARRLATDQLVQLEQAHLAAATRRADLDARARLLDAQLALCQMLGDYQRSTVDDPEKAAALWQEIVQQWTVRGQLAPLKPLTPEQLAASTMQATGFFARTAAAAQAAAEKTPPPQLQQDDLPEDEKARLQKVALQTQLLDQLRGSVNQFVAQYGGLAGEEFQATVNQALFLGNSAVISGWLAASGESLVARLTQVDQPQTLADELTLAVFSRPATLDEQQEFTDFLATPTDDPAPDRPAALADLVWALISSAEFRFNH